MPAVRITLLVDARAARGDLETEHGLSFLVEAGGEVLLFDGGASGAAFRNAERLGLPWREISRIVVSHGHRDHTAGLGAFLEALPEARVYLHPGALAPKYRHAPGRPPRLLTMPGPVQTLLQARMDRLHWATAPMIPGPGLHLTGPIPRIQRAGPGPFRRDPEGREPDALEDDLALGIVTPRGVVGLLGCAHAGLANTLDQLGALAGVAALHGVVGGLHLGPAGPVELEGALEALRRHGVARVAPAHCTGPAAAAAIGAEWGEAGRELRAGESLVFG